MRRHPYLFCVISLILCYLQAEQAIAQRSLIRTYTVGDGLVMNRIRGFYQDKDDFIWMYTWDGLSRYEGYRFRNYIAGRDLRHSFVNDMMQSADGTIYLPLNDSSIAIMRDLRVQPEHLMPSEVINDFYIDKNGKIYAATDHSGICEFRDGQLIPPTRSMEVKSIQYIIHYKDHFFFIGPYEGPSGVYDNNFELVASWEGSPAFYTSIYQDHRDRIFICTQGGLKEVDFAKPGYALKDVGEIPFDAYWKNWSVTSVEVTKENDMWIGTNKGLVHLRSDQTWSVLTDQDGLLSNQISALFVDKSHTLWIGTDAGAASINLQTRILNNGNIPGVFVNYVLPANEGSVYLISGFAFASHVDKDLQIQKNADFSKPQNIPLGLVPYEDNVLLMRQFELEVLDTALFPYRKTDVIRSDFFYVEQGDKYWIAAGFGLSCVSLTGLSARLGDTSYNATNIADGRNGHLLIGTLQSGVFLARPDPDPATCKLEKVKDLTGFLDDSQVRSMLTSKNGDVWIGSRFNGLVRLQCNEDYSDCNKQSYTIADGLVSNWITSLAEDQYGNIWVGSASGVDKLIPRGDKYYVFSFSRINGYYAYARHVVVHEDGSIWVGHNEGLSRIVDGRIDTIGPPNTFITEVTLGGKDYTSLHAAAVRLKYNQNSAHFAFAAPDYINTSQLMFTYRLLGSKDTSWSVPVKTHEIFYGNLTPGKFRFEVASFGWNGERSKPVSYAFEIMNPFWKQTWFIALALLLIATAVFAIYRFRVSQIHQVVTVRDRIAADLHDEIGSSLTHINILSEIGRQQHPETNGATNLFERIGSEVQSSAEALDDIIWSVRTRRDAIGDVIARMRQYATEIFEPAGVNFQLNESVEGIQSLEMEFKRDFYLVYKEVLRNILKHAEASHVDINIKVDRFSVAIQVKDNGKGFDINTPTERSGLANIKARVEKWKGNVSWHSNTGKGTEVKIEMKPG